MSVKYSIVERPDPRDITQPRKFYPTIKRTETVTLDSMVDTISDYSTVNPPDVLAVLESLIRLVPKQLLQGRGVNFGSLGTFYLSASSEGSDTEEDVNESKFKKIYLRFLPSKKLKNKFRDIFFEKISG